VTQFLRFLGVGAVAAIVNIAARMIFSTFMPFELAVAAAFPFGVLVAFTLSRKYVFAAGDGAMGPQLLRFVAVNLVALVLVWAVSVGLADFAFPAISFTWHAEDIAHIIGVFAPAVTSYLGHRYYSFRT